LFYYFVAVWFDIIFGKDFTVKGKGRSWSLDLFGRGAEEGFWDWV
jgi:hypothetical protein